MDEIVRDFLAESSENMDKLDKNLVKLEQNPGSKDLVDEILRAIHTVKGTCSFLGFSKLENLTHAGESLLEKLREGELTVTPEITSGLLALVDAVRAILENIEKTEKDGDDDYSTLIQQLTRLQSVKTPENHPSPASSAPATKHPAPTQKGLKSRTHKPTPPVAGAEDRTSIRVDVSLLDELMNLVGELVLSRDQVMQFTSNHSDPTLIKATQRLNLITSKLQRSLMKTRMQPIGNIWDKFPRIVRDLATSCGKKVHLEQEGQDTELDKALLEAIKDPLTHIIRNSIDHGIESPEKRRAAGKPEEGTLKLKAFHEGGRVNIEISDDGGGISPDKIREKALEKGLITPEQANKMTEHQLTDLIFLPGFSTADKITHISGRGVGMDVVRANIERVNGIMDLQSIPGQGTTLKIMIPLTFAIITALVVVCGKERYAIPQASLLDIVRQNGKNPRHAIEIHKGSPHYRFHNQLIPLVSLRKELGITKNNAKAPLNIVILQGQGRPFGLIVDEISDTQEIVVKPLAKQLKEVSLYAGSTITGDGNAALILDVLF